jgi:hypothetical protein
MSRQLKIIFCLPILLFGLIAMPAHAAHVSVHSASHPRSYQTKSYTIRKSPTYKSSSYEQPRQKSGFLHSVTSGIGHGIGFGIGSEMGHSIWHTFFGFGGNHYRDDNGQTGQASPGYLGWIILIVIGFLIWRWYKRRQ